MLSNIKQRLVLMLSLVCLLAGGTLSVQARQSLLTNYTPDGKSFSYATAINFQKQSFKAVLDLSTCEDSKANENILSIGDDLQGANGWGGVNVIHLFNTKSNNNLELDCFDPRSRTHYEVLKDISGELTIELKSDGLYINGVQRCDASAVSNILAMSSILYGSTQGNTRSWATYKEISLEDVGGGSTGGGGTTTPTDRKFDASWIQNQQKVGDYKEDAHATFIPYASVEAMKSGGSLRRTPRHSCSTASGSSSSCPEHRTVLAKASSSLPTTTTRHGTTSACRSLGRWQATALRYTPTWATRSRTIRRTPTWATPTTAWRTTTP